jgi:phosphoglycolate phosphatase
MKKYKALLCDLDGTLLNTLNDIGNAANRVLSRRNLPVHPLDAYRYFVGDGVKTLFSRALPEASRDASMVMACMDDFNREYAENWHSETSLYPGISEMLDLGEDRGLRLAILSNKPQEFTQYCADGFLSNWTFEVVFGHQELIPPKPDPTGALEISRRMGIAPSSFLYLGDTGVDMRTACSAGMYPVGALWGFRTAEELLENGAKTLAGHPLDVADLFS